MHRARIHVRLGEDMFKPEALETYARALLRDTDGDLQRAFSSGDQGSSMLQSLTLADCLLVLPVGQEIVPAGTVVSRRYRCDDNSSAAPPTVVAGPDRLGRMLRDLRDLRWSGPLKAD